MVLIDQFQSRDGDHLAQGRGAPHRGGLSPGDARPARRFPDRTELLAILDSVIPGTSMFDEVSRDGTKVWHFHFHQAPDLPEALTQGREALYLERFWHDMAVNGDAIDAEAFAFYMRCFSRPGGMPAGHWLTEENPEGVADALINFIQTTQEPAA